MGSGPWLFRSPTWGLVRGRGQDRKTSSSVWHHLNLKKLLEVWGLPAQAELDQRLTTRAVKCLWRMHIKTGPRQEELSKNQVHRDGNFLVWHEASASWITWNINKQPRLLSNWYHHHKVSGATSKQSDCAGHMLQLKLDKRNVNFPATQQQQEEFSWTCHQKQMQNICISAWCSWTQELLRSRNKMYIKEILPVIRKQIMEQSLAHIFHLAVLFLLPGEMYNKWKGERFYMRGPHEPSWIHIQTAVIWEVNLFNSYESIITHSSKISPGCDPDVLLSTGLHTCCC